MVRESTVLARTRKAFLAQFPDGYCMKTSGGGEPDLICSGLGQAYAIETKVPGKSPTPLQFFKLRKWRRAGAVALWTTDGRTMNRIDE